MGELLLCNSQIGAMPYFIETISLNVYSVEELVYYIANNVYLLDSDFMNEELCTWLEKEQGMIELTDILRDLMRDRCKLSEFIEAIITQVYYLNQTQINDILAILVQMEEKSEFERDKMRADRLMEKEKYLASIYAYKHLLLLEDAKTCDYVVLGNILHNLGTAYARLFLFEEAIVFYEKAYMLNEDFESLKELLFCYRCMHDEENFMRVAIENGLPDEKIQEVKDELTMYSRDSEIHEFEEQLIKFSEDLNRGERTDFSKFVLANLSEWKDEYRRICRV